MSKVVIGVVYAVVMIAVIVSVDLAFLRDQPVLRLAVNAAIAAVAAVLYMLVFRRRRP